MRERFIVLMDFSEEPENLIRYAAGWAERVAAELVFVQKTTALIPGLADAETKRMLLEKTNAEDTEKLKAMVERIVSPVVRTSYSVTDESVQQRLHRLLEEDYHHLVFIGLKRVGLLEKWLVGSKPLRIIENTPDIFVAIPEDISRFSHGKVFVGIAAEHPLNVLEFRKLLGFLDPADIEIIFFHLAKPDENVEKETALLQKLSQAFAADFTTDFKIYEGNSAFDDIRKVINNKIEEILVVQEGSRLLSDRLFRRFLINDLIYEGRTPLIILPE
ncbi:MAG: universal stress protein [Chryseobacterium sp.]|nr:MAG: universal stress protein [Chryseobacterium sp.]